MQLISHLCKKKFLKHKTSTKYYRALQANSNVDEKSNKRSRTIITKRCFQKKIVPIGIEQIEFKG